MRVQLFCLCLTILVCVGSSENNVCPFDYLYHFGDGVTDIGNSVLVFPTGNSLPPALPPYGMTFPGKPNGRWSDGLIDFDFAGRDFGFPNLVPYLSKKSNNGVIFSVARSPVLDRPFFTSRAINIPSYTVSLSNQMKWFKTHLRSICSTKQECAKILGNSLVLLGDIEANDVGYALSQGKSISEVKTYIPFVTRAQIKVIRELINMGARRIIAPGSAPLGCFPYMLTARSTADANAYDDLGCLKDVNELITFKNDHFQQAFNKVAKEFPGVFLQYGPFGDGLLQAIREARSGPHRDIALKSCCGVGGKYNYDNRRLCGSRRARVCSNPGDYIFWDGMHLTHNASLRIEQNLIQPALVSLNCTQPSVAYM